MYTSALQLSMPLAISSRHARPPRIRSVSSQHCAHTHAPPRRPSGLPDPLATVAGAAGQLQRRALRCAADVRVHAPGAVARTRTRVRTSMIVRCSCSCVHKF